MDMTPDYSESAIYDLLWLMAQPSTNADPSSLCAVTHSLFVPRITAVTSTHTRVDQLPPYDLAGRAEPKPVLKP